MTSKNETGIQIPIRQNSVAMRVSDEVIAMEYGFHQRGHLEPVTPTPEQVAQHARAVELIAEIEANPYLRVGGYDYEIDVEPLKTERWVADETHEEWMARWRVHRAANPDEKRPGSFVDQMMAKAFAEAMRPSPIADLLRGSDQ